MTDVILGFLVIILSLSGAVSFIRFLLFRIYKNKNDKTIMLIAPFEGTCEDIEYILRSCATRIKWMGKVRPYRVICLDNGMSASAREVCKAICREYEFMDIMNKEELDNLLKHTEQQF